MSGEAPKQKKRLGLMDRRLSQDGKIVSNVSQFGRHPIPILL
jgi:hypothetical protein